MDDLAINITVEGGVGEGATPESDVANETEGAKDNAQLAFTIDMALRVAEQTATQLSTGIVTSLGARTGNTALQNQIQGGVSAVGEAVGVGVAFAANPYLGIIALAGKATSKAFEFTSRAIERMWSNRQATELARRAGYLSTRSR